MEDNNLDYSVNNRFKPPYDPIIKAQQILTPATTTEEVYARAGLTQPEQPSRPDAVPMDEVPSEPIQTTPIADTTPSVEPTVTKKERGTTDIFDKALEQYPYLQDKNISFTYIPDEDPKAGVLEFWQPNDPGGDKYQRPEEIPLDSIGIEMRSSKTRPIDILGDYVSHYAVEGADPTLTKIYQEFIKTIPEKQQRSRYEYAVNNENEDRPYETWKQMVGDPGMFRGYTFDQFPKEEINKMYSPEQLALLDQAKEYLGLKEVTTQGVTPNEPPVQPTDSVSTEPVVGDTTNKKAPEVQPEPYVMKEYDRALTEQVYKNLPALEGLKGDETGAAATGKYGFQTKLYKEYQKKYPGITEDDAIKQYVTDLHSTFIDKVEGYRDLDFNVQADLLGEAYNLGSSMSGYPKLKETIKAVATGKEPNVGQIFLELLDTATIEKKASAGLAVRRAKIYNKHNSDKIIRVNIDDKGTITYYNNKNLVTGSFETKGIAKSSRKGNYAVPN